jgi:hypothetical protein
MFARQLSTLIVARIRSHRIGKLMAINLLYPGEDKFPRIQSSGYAEQIACDRHVIAHF